MLRKPMAEKIIRDPVHDVIAFQTDRPVDALLFRLVNTAEFQRLRRVRQLGLASLAYPGADHSRYSHSLGVMETARKILAQLRQSFPIDPEGELLCLVGALLHDIGHGPFSHVFERITGVHHEDVGRRVILDPAGEVRRTLADFDTALPQRLADFLDCRPRRTFFHDILSSRLDADRCDYLLRDNMMTGSRYGDYDLSWLVHAFTIDTQGDRLAITWKGVSAVEGYLQARYHMYRNVYFHKVVRSGEGMVGLALQLARRLSVQERLPWPPRGHVVHKALRGQSLNFAEFVQLDDTSMLESFKAWAASDDATLAQLCRGLLFRRLYKVIDLTHLAGHVVTSSAQAKGIEALAQRVALENGGDYAYDLFLDEPNDSPYEAFDPDDPCGGAGIIVLGPDGRATDLGGHSPLIAALRQQLVFRRLHVAEYLKPLLMTRLGANGEGVGGE